MKWWLKQSLNIQIIVCVFLGILIGLLVGPKISIIKPIGTIFLRFLKMLVVPLIFFTIVSAIISMNDVRTLRSLGGRAIIYFFSTSILATAIGIICTKIFAPGKNSISSLESQTIQKTVDFNLVDTVVSWFPENPIEALAQGNILQVIIFAVIVGCVLLLLGSKVTHLQKLTTEGADLMISITNLVMKIAPYGILALVANMVVSFDRLLIADVGLFIIAYYCGIIILFVVVYPILVRYFAHMNPIKFYQTISPAILIAASTTSSAATQFKRYTPIKQKVHTINMGIKKWQNQNQR